MTKSRKGRYRTVESALGREQWRHARGLIKALLKEEPDSHWLLTRLGLTFHEERNYVKAMYYTRKALSLYPNCPLVLWDYACVLDMLGRKKEALAIYGRLIRRGIDRLAYGECGEGLAWARGLVASCYYRRALCYGDLGLRRRARNSLVTHLRMRGPGCQSWYPLREVRDELKNLALRK